MDDDVNAAESRANGVGHGRAAFSGVISAATNKLVSARLLGCVRAVVSTLAPPSPSLATTAWPIPLLPPVTRTRLPSNSWGSINVSPVMRFCRLPVGIQTEDRWDSRGNFRQPGP